LQHLISRRHEVAPPPPLQPVDGLLFGRRPACAGRRMPAIRLTKRRLSAAGKLKQRYALGLDHIVLQDYRLLDGSCGWHIVRTSGSRVGASLVPADFPSECGTSSPVGSRASADRSVDTPWPGRAAQGPKAATRYQARASGMSAVGEGRGDQHGRFNRSTHRSDASWLVSLTQPVPTTREVEALDVRLLPCKNTRRYASPI